MTLPNRAEAQRRADEIRVFNRELERLQQEGVAATPGVDFGSNGTDRFVRFAYTRGMADLEDAAARIRRFCGR